MKKILLIYVTAIAWAAQPLMAQDNLWATGSAVPGGIQQLVKRPDGQFRFSGPLNAGEVKIRTTEEYQQGTTRYLMPQLTDSYLINYGLKYSLTTDSAKAGWQVLFQEDTYRFIVNTSSQTVKGEVMLPWNEVLIAGSAFIGGSDNIEWKRDNMLPFVRDHENPYVFTWIGELGLYDNVIEPGHFKLEGQMTWGPRELHPYVQDEDLLSSTQMRQGGDDTKWHVYIPGTYHIVVDLFNETFHAELIAGANTYETDGVTGMEGTSDSMPTAVYNMGGVRMPSLQKGLNIVRTANGKVRKIYCK